MEDRNVDLYNITGDSPKYSSNLSLTEAAKVMKIRQDSLWLFPSNDHGHAMFGYVFCLGTELLQHEFVHQIFDVVVHEKARWLVVTQDQRHFLRMCRVGTPIRRHIYTG